jgi:2-iminobutanoate/2-iminopropanoate deaminase
MKLSACSSAAARLGRTLSSAVSFAKAEDFNAMNEVYGAFFFDGASARTTVQANLVEPGMKVEIDCVAYLPQQLDAR